MKRLSGTNSENALTPGERLNELLPNTEVVAGATDCLTGAGDPNIIPVHPDRAFSCV